MDFALASTLTAQKFAYHARLPVTVWTVSLYAGTFAQTLFANIALNQTGVYFFCPCGKQIVTHPNWWLSPGMDGEMLD